MFLVYEAGKWSEFCGWYYQLKRGEITEEQFFESMKELFKILSLDGQKYGCKWTENQLLDWIGQVHAAYKVGEESSLDYEFVIDGLAALRAYVRGSYERDLSWFERVFGRKLFEKPKKN